LRGERDEYYLKYGKLYCKASDWFDFWYRHPALRDGTGYGLIIGMLFALLIFIENFSSFSGQIITPLTLVFMLFIWFIVVGWRYSLKFGQIRQGMIAYLWCAFVGVIIALFVGFMVNFLFEHQLEQTQQASSEYLRGSVQDLKTFTFYNTLDSASTHLFEVPSIAIVFGFMGSLMSKGFTYLSEYFNRQSN
jgi:hypothetical protein